MNDLYEVAGRVFVAVQRLGLRCCVIGGLALQFRGQDRLTRDVDFSVLTGFADEEAVATALLEEFPARFEGALEHALSYRVLLLEYERIGIDIGLAGFPYEEAAIDRATMEEISPGLVLPIVSAEDLIIMKAFASRPQDWVDIRGIIVRQGTVLDWNWIYENLNPLAELKEDPEVIPTLERIREELR
ncbi:MAG: nucleotidyl transferase AbiEii/AbiGii toxin family protein [Fimbriimonadaceae bacterium]|nr:nucleotidyl transferase AbiEii/AbiGii toxin family protein [Fimbriimonadaceae bacterium]